MLATDQHHDAARRIQRAVRSKRVRRAARLLNKLPVELRELTVQMAYESSLRESNVLQAAVTKVVCARFVNSGKSLGLALIESRSWEDAALGAHLRELRRAYTLATKYQTALSLGAIGDMLNAALYYIARLHYDTKGDWKQLQVAMSEFAQAVLQRVPQRERREAAASMGLKSMIELTCVMIGA